jgi:hypothetical protein
VKPPHVGFAASVDDALTQYNELQSA